MSDSRPLSPILLAAMVVALMLAFGAGTVAAETADDRRLHLFAGMAASHASDVQALLARGADPHWRDRDGRTALHAAAAIGAVESVRLLLEAGAKPNLRDADGNRPLHFASDLESPRLSTLGSIATIRLLLRARATPDIANNQGRTPLHLAARSYTEPGGVAALISAGADPNRKDRDGNTPLHAALSPNRSVLRVVQTLLGAGADPTIVNKRGLSALQRFVALAGDYGYTAELLIKAGADPDRKYRNGDAPLHVAIRGGGSGKVEVAKALLAGGADPCVRDAKGYTPYQIAAKGGAIHRALDRAGGHDLGCDKKGQEVAGAGTGEARVMQARTRSNVRSGPGTQHGKVGLLETGQKVRVLGEAGDWLRIEMPGGGEAFVYGSLLVETPAVTNLEPKCAGLPKGSQCWREFANRPGCHFWHPSPFPGRTGSLWSWSGKCNGGVAEGEGTLGVFHEKTSDYREAPATISAGDIALKGGFTIVKKPSDRDSQEPVRQDTAVLEPKCGESQRSQCWMEFANRPGCHFWNRLRWAASWSWSGKCDDGVAEGEGTFGVRLGKTGVYRDAPATISAGDVALKGSFAIAKRPSDKGEQEPVRQDTASATPATTDNPWGEDSTGPDAVARGATDPWAKNDPWAPEGPDVRFAEPVAVREAPPRAVEGAGIGPSNHEKALEKLEDDRRVEQARREAEARAARADEERRLQAQRDEAARQEAAVRDRAKQQQYENEVVQERTGSRLSPYSRSSGLLGSGSDGAIASLRRIQERRRARERENARIQEENRRRQAEARRRLVEARRQAEARRRAEDRRRQEENRRREAEYRRQQEENNRRRLARLREEERRRDELRRKQQEQARLRKEEQARREAEYRRQQEQAEHRRQQQLKDARRREEAKLRKEEQARREAEYRRQQEQAEHRRQQQLKDARRREEQQRRQLETNRKVQEARLREEARRRDEAAKKQQEQTRRQEEARRRAKAAGPSQVSTAQARHCIQDTSQGIRNKCGFSVAVRGYCKGDRLRRTNYPFQGVYDASSSWSTTLYPGRSQSTPCGSRGAWMGACRQPYSVYFVTGGKWDCFGGGSGGSVQ